jgi:transaldolase
VTASNPPQHLNQLGQSLWLDNITRDLLDSGTLARYIAELSITGLTSNPTIFDKAIAGTSAYDADIRRCAAAGMSAEDTFFDLAIADLARAADAFRPIHDRTMGVDGFVSLEVSPLLAYDAATTTSEAVRLHGAAGRPNLFIKIPGTAEGLTAIEETIFAGVPVNVTLLFSPGQYLACMEAYTRGIERRVEAGLPAYVASVASVFLSRWDAAVSAVVGDELRNRLGLLIGRQSYAEYRRFYATDRWQRLMNLGARPQRLLFASTGTKDPAAPDDLYVAGLIAPNTVDTAPEETILKYADHGSITAPIAPETPGDAELAAAFTAAGVDMDALAAELQSKGAASFVASWTAMLARITAKASASG